jgi:hypothetical protein
MWEFGESPQGKTPLVHAPDVPRSRKERSQNVNDITSLVSH